MDDKKKNPDMGNFALICPILSQPFLFQQWMLHGDRGPPIFAATFTYLRHRADRCPSVFANHSSHSPWQRRRRARKKQSTIERTTLYIRRHDHMIILLNVD
jgi:hypothetical protein